MTQSLEYRFPWFREQAGIIKMTTESYYLK